MNIIITGATGFQGRNLVERLHQDGMRVMATGRSTVMGDALLKQRIDIKRRLSATKSTSSLRTLRTVGPGAREGDRIRSDSPSTRY
jgi:nucleoside-diphosphate-sugar epimerase